MRNILKIKCSQFPTTISYSTFAKTVLGIETSCDDTAVGVVNDKREILTESKYNQWSVHKQLGSPKKNLQSTSWAGGVIPNLARKMHYENIILAVNDCIEALDSNWKNIDAIALTMKPGLEPCLWEGIKFTKLLLKKYNHLKFIPIHHMEAHALTARLFDSKIKYPFLTLLISGGHSLLALVKDVNNFYRLGESLDISPGNCIDKIARQMGLFEFNKNDCLSGGALLEKMALNGDPNSFSILSNSIQNFCYKNKDCNFSFAGLLSAVFRIIDKELQIKNDLIIVNNIEKLILKENVICNISASVQAAITRQLEDRLKRSIIYLELNKVKIEHVVIAGGVASNKYIRRSLENVCSQFGMSVSIPPITYCTDNGVMIAWNGVEKLIQNNKDIILPNQQNDSFYENLKPCSKSDLGISLIDKLKILKIRV